jgi:hypothetical protein
VDRVAAAFAQGFLSICGESDTTVPRRRSVAGRLTRGGIVVD